MKIKDIEIYAEIGGARNPYEQELSLNAFSVLLSGSKRRTGAGAKNWGGSACVNGRNVN
jgi:hypothetical protein